MKSCNVVLASASPRRCELLKTIIKSFRVMPSDVDENIEFSNPTEYALTLASLKAQSVYNALVKVGESALVIGADTIVVLNGRVLGKPSNRSEAVEMLFSLRNTTHTVITGVCVIDSSGARQDSKTTTVRIGDIPDDMIYSYIDSGAPYDKAGGYGIQDFKDSIEIFAASHDNVMGLPLDVVKKLVKR